MQNRDSGACVTRKGSFQPVEVVHRSSLEKLQIQVSGTSLHATIFIVGELLILNNIVQRFPIRLTEVDNLFIWYIQRDILEGHLGNIPALPPCTDIMIQVYIRAKVGG